LTPPDIPPSGFSADATAGEGLKVSFLPFPTANPASDYIVFSIFSSQIDSNIALRYRNNRYGVVMGLATFPAFIPYLVILLIALPNGKR
jgi:hypothetical protein